MAITNTFLPSGALTTANIAGTTYIVPTLQSHASKPGTVKTFEGQYVLPHSTDSRLNVALTTTDNMTRNSRRETVEMVIPILTVNDVSGAEVISTAFFRIFGSIPTDTVSLSVAQVKLLKMFALTQYIGALSSATMADTTISNWNVGARVF